MKVINLTEGSTVYTSNTYLVLGDWKTLADVNGMVDVGRDPAMLERLREAATGVGKPKVQRVVLTHGHYDHAGLLPTVREVYRPEVCAASPYLQGVDRLVQDGDALELGDGVFEVIRTPGHSSDSICLYCEANGTLFSGDTPVAIRETSYTCEANFVEALEKLCSRNVCIIYPGHGAPIRSRCNETLRQSLRNVRAGRVTPGVVHPETRSTKHRETETF